LKSTKLGIAPWASVRTETPVLYLWKSLTQIAKAANLARGLALLCLTLALPLQALAIDQSAPWVSAAVPYQATVASGKRTTESGSVDHPLPEGFRNYVTTVTHGLGSFQVAAPKSWHAWVRDLSPQDVASAVGKVNQDWASGFARQMDMANRTAGAPQSGILVAIDDGAVVVVQISVLGSFDEARLADWIRDPMPVYKQANGGTVDELTWFEHHEVKALKTQSTEPERTHKTIDYFLPETRNGVMWLIKCFMPAGLFSDYAGVCDDIRATFVAGPFIIKDHTTRHIGI